MANDPMSKVSKIARCCLGYKVMSMMMNFLTGYYYQYVSQIAVSFLKILCIAKKCRKVMKKSLFRHTRCQGEGGGRCVGNPENLFRLANSGATFTSHGVHVEVWG
ncbi:hypothetical protein AAG906_032324 [Vitis piasezkii]